MQPHSIKDWVNNISLNNTFFTSVKGVTIFFYIKVLAIQVLWYSNIFTWPPPVNPHMGWFFRRGFSPPLSWGRSSCRICAITRAVPVSTASNRGSTPKLASCLSETCSDLSAPHQSLPAWRAIPNWPRPGHQCRAAAWEDSREIQYGFNFTTLFSKITLKSMQLRDISKNWYFGIMHINI